MSGKFFKRVCVTIMEERGRSVQKIQTLEKLIRSAAATTPAGDGKEQEEHPKESLFLPLVRNVSELNGTGSSVNLRAAIEQQLLGWDEHRPGVCMGYSPLGLTVFKVAKPDMYGGAIGKMKATAKVYSFVIMVRHPVDDCFWVGVAYHGTVQLGNVAPKRNREAIIWSGGNASTGRPGTIRVHGEKFRNQSSYR